VSEISSILAFGGVKMRYNDLFKKQLLDAGLFSDGPELDLAVKEYTMLILDTVALKTDMPGFDLVETYNQIIRDDNTQSFGKMANCYLTCEPELKRSLLESAALKLALAYVRDTEHRTCKNCKQRFEAILYPVFYRLQLT